MDNAYPPITTTTIIFREPQPPPFPDSPRSVDLSPLEFILALLAIVTIPALIYAFFFAFKCPLWPSSSSSRNRSDPEPEDKESVSGVNYQKDSHVKNMGSECPVCLSPFSDGEQVKQLSACNHSFHANCIDLWLNSHPSCPVCRAIVGPKRPSPSSGPSRPSRYDSDFHQGLPDSSNLV